MENAIAERNPPLKGIINSVRWNEPAPDGSGNKRLDPAIVSGAINYKELPIGTTRSIIRQSGLTQQDFGF